MLYRVLILLATSLSLNALGGCAATTTTSPYSARSDLARNPLEAQRLTLEAADLIATDPDGAEAILRAALTADLYHGPAHNNLGVVYLEQGKLYEAANEFEWARKLMPGHPDPRMNLALTLERAGRVDDALASYEAALDVYPGHIPTTQALCRCQLRHGREDARTRGMLEVVTLHGDTEGWRSWATRQLLRLP